MKKTIIMSVMLLGIIFLAGCGQQPVSQVQKKETISNQQKDKIITSNQATSQDINTWNIYKNETHNFSIKYPNDWIVNEDKSLAGPFFMPKDLNIKIPASIDQDQKFDKNKDCFFSIFFTGLKQDGKIPCKIELGKIILGSNNFTKCETGNRLFYELVHPKNSSQVIMFDHYRENSSCTIIFEKSLETLTFN